MELIVINETKLKIMLTETDMNEYNLDSVSVSPENEHARRAFRHLLAEAKDKTGFDAVGERVYVQFYPSKTGGCELFVTKLGFKEERSKEENDPMTTERRYYSSPQQYHSCLYRFSELADLLGACRILSENDYRGKSEAFTESTNGPFYLMVEEETPLAAEFFGKLCKPNTADYIKEHCRTFCRNAVARLGTLS